MSLQILCQINFCENLPISQLTGTPLSAAKRLQFALEVKAIPEIEIMKTMPEVIFPLFWVEEGAHLGRDWTNKIKNSLFL